MNPPALIRFWHSVSALIDNGSDHAFFSPLNTAPNTSGPPMRSKRNSSHIMFVHSDWPASEIGAMPLSLNFLTRSMMSPQDCGGGGFGWAKIFLFQYRKIGRTRSPRIPQSLSSVGGAP